MRISKNDTNEPNTKDVNVMSIEELRRDLNAACYDYDKVQAEGTTGRNTWSLIYIDRRIKELKKAIKKHDDRLIELQQS